MKKLFQSALDAPRRLLTQSAERAAGWARGLFVTQEDRDLAATKGYWDDSVTLTLSNLAREAETRASGRVQVLSLADFRTAIGELWDTYQEKILIIAESTIARMIGRGNTFIPQGEDAWLLLFPGLDEDKAEDRTDAIAAAIGKKLVGAQFTSHELPMPSSARLDLGGAVNADGSLNMDAVRNAVSKVKQKQIAQTIAQRKPMPVRPKPISGTATANPTLGRSAADQMKPMYRPAWCAETQAMDSFFFRAFNDAGDNIYADDAPPVGDATILDLTKSAVSAFRAMREGGLHAKMSIPIPFLSAQGPVLSDIQRAVAALPQKERLMHLRLEIVRIPPSITSERLVPLREMFRAYVREVAFMVDMVNPNAQVLALDHIMLGVEFDPGTVGSDEQVFQEMLMFRQRAGRRPAYILDLHSRAHMLHAVRAGFYEVGGPALHDDVRHLPAQITRTPRENLLTP